jgi:hypothetical protein
MKGDKNVDVEDGVSVDIEVGVGVDLEGGKMYMLQEVRRKI